MFKVNHKDTKIVEERFKWVKIGGKDSSVWFRNWKTQRNSLIFVWPINIPEILHPPQKKKTTTNKQKNKKNPQKSAKARKKDLYKFHTQKNARSILV